ncbi:MAG: TRAP transporter large permease [Leptothrix sp. (in: b-proteobacteria)]
MTATLILVALVALLFTGVPIFAGLTLFGAALMAWHQSGPLPVAEVFFGEISRYLLVTIPLFTFMAHVMIRGRIVDDLYGTAYTLTRHLPGGLGVATIIACTIFAAISGSSVATALTIGAVAIPQMERFGYDPKVAYGLVAAGGTLGILIPPSGPMVLYGMISETSIGGLFMAGVLPGLMMAGIFIVWIMASTRWGGEQSRHIRREPRASLTEMLAALRKSFWAFMLPTVVLGGMYAGVFTATEAAAAGALAAMLVAMLIYRSVGPRGLWEAALDASRTSAMLFMIVAGASVFAHVITDLRIPQQIVQGVIALNIGKYGFLIGMMGVLLVLGMFLESIAIILVSTPVILPVLHSLQIDTIWYGILLTINLELALIHPPVGMNLFTIKAIARGATMGQIALGALPYVALLILGLALVMIWPEIALWLPHRTLNLG